jgi:hypothetical protein
MANPSTTTNVTQVGPTPGASIPISDQSAWPTLKDSDTNAWSKTVGQDLRTIAMRMQAMQSPTPITGGYRASMPYAGVCDVYARSDTATAGSNGTNYHIVNATQNGQAYLANQTDTRQHEIAAYTDLYLGQFKVGQGDVIAIKVAVTGAPSPTLSVNNFSIRCNLVQRA